MEPERKQRAKEENAIVLDFLQHGYADDPRPLHRKESIVQAIGKTFFTLLELVPQPGIALKPFDEVYIGEGKRDKISFIRAALFPDKLTQTAKSTMPAVVDKIISDREAQFVEYVNQAGPISLRAHQLELLPGIGKRHAQDLLKAREEKPFTSFAEMRQRLPAMDVKKALMQRILDEIEGKDRFRLFVRV